MKLIPILILSCLFNYGIALAYDCQHLLTIETDDSRIYTELGKVSLCEKAGKIAMVRIQKPVRPNNNSDQFDERNPYKNIFFKDIKNTYKTAVLKPKRFGLEVVALFIEIKQKDINNKTGGEIKLKYLHNYLTKSYKTIKITLKKSGSKWNVFLKTRYNTKKIQKLFVETKFAGVKRIQFN